MAKKCELDKDFKGTQCGIDSRIILVWLLPVLTAIVGFWVLLRFVYYSDPNFSAFGISSAVEIYAVLLALLFLLGLPAFVWFLLRHRSIKYTIAEDQLIVQEGVINKKRTVIPYEKIQDIKVRRPVLYRIFGLGYIEIETAGVGGTSPEGVIPGVANADQVVKEILTHVQTFQTPHSAKHEQDSGVHEAILSEIRELRKEMEARGYQTETNVGKPAATKKEAKAKPEKESAKSGVIRGGKTCLPVEHAEPDRLGNKRDSEPDSIDEALRELKELRRKLEKS